MTLKISLSFLVVVVALTVSILCQGCTITFKGKDVELSGRTIVAYELVDIGFTNGTPR